MTMHQPQVQTNESDLAIIVITALIFAIFIVGLASVCYRWSSRRFYTVEQSVNLSTTHSEHELQTVRRARSNTTARGIDAAIVKSFPTFLYSEVKEQRIGKGGVECAVCLCEFQDDDTLSLMPNCCHVYHAGCVSVWLSEHSTCPLCRVDLIGFQPGQGSDPDPELGVIVATEVPLSESITWTNGNRLSRSMSMRLSHCPKSEILLSRSRTIGHAVVEPIENVDRFTLRLPDDVLTRLVPTQVRSPRRFYRSRSVGSQSIVVLEQWYNYKKNGRIPSMTFFFANHCVLSGGDAVAPATPNTEQSREELQPDDRV